MNLAITVHAENLAAKMAGAPDAVRRNLMVAVNKLSIEVQRSVKQDKLTGQVLHVRTGTLRRSINREIESREDGVFAVVGTNVEYAAAHEYGFSGQVSIAAHVRKARDSGRMKKAGLAASGDTVVRAHTRNVNMPERSFLRSTLKEFEPRIVRELRDAAVGALR